jgi:hypothetical protein
MACTRLTEWRVPDLHHVSLHVSQVHVFSFSSGPPESRSYTHGGWFVKPALQFWHTSVRVRGSQFPENTGIGDWNEVSVMCENIFRANGSVQWRRERYGGTEITVLSELALHQLVPSPGITGQTICMRLYVHPS